MKKLRALLVVLMSTALAFGLITAADAVPGGGGGGSGGEHGGPNDPNCEDGDDNDGDQLTDRDDPDCLKPGCKPSSQTPNKCFESNDDSPGPEPGTCNNNQDDDGDGIPDSEEDECQADGCVVEGVNTCNEVDDRDPPTPGTCNNNQDDDGDGIPDSEEDECQADGCVVEGVNTCNEVDDRDPPTPGTCNNNQDDDGDGIPDSEEDECQADGCVVEDVNTCDEVFDPPTGGADHCRVPPDSSLLALFAANGAPIPEEYRDTLGQELYDALLSEIGGPLFEDPEHNGAITGPIGEAAHDFPPPEFPAEAAPLAELIQAALFEVACVGDAVIEEGNSPLPLPADDL